MAIKLIVMDLDGTLLDSKKEISARSVQAIEAARQKGVLATVATGRMHVAAAHFSRRIGVTLPVISCNGGLVRYGAGDTLFAASFPAPLAQEVLDACYKNDWYAQWYIDDRIYAKEFRPALFYSYKMIEEFKICEIGEAYLPYVNNVVQVVVRDADGRIGEIQSAIKGRFGGRIEQQQNTDVSVDLSPMGINKAVGIERLIRHLGIRKEEVMAFGDADNDLAMLEYAGIGVAMGNAIDEAKKVADFVTGDNDHNGIADAIESFVLRD